ncbi:hypothetical protein K7432_013065 [Basidiobolus ranarum]|uniref:Uncharacterized protein n=1 Tax=Basidiobolus ranarum TaxID=34480 RepID=A0ABR2WJU6_9FUNG
MIFFGYLSKYMVDYDNWPSLCTGGIYSETVCDLNSCFTRRPCAKIRLFYMYKCPCSMLAYTKDTGSGVYEEMIVHNNSRNSDSNALNSKNTTCSYELYCTGKSNFITAYSCLHD